MGYVYLLLVAFLFSFGGTCVRLIKPYYGPEYITCFRFLVGVFLLFLLKAAKRQRFPKDFKAVLFRNRGWILFGAVTKWLAYLTENYALSKGPSYGNIVAQPAQTIFIALVSVYLFHEKLSWKKRFCILVCIAGVLCVSWNGRSPEAFFHSNLYLMGLFLLTGILAGCHILAQKMIADRMDIIDSNLSIFMVSGALSAAVLLPDVAGGSLAGIRPDAACLLAILLFGFNTGIGFYLNAKAIPLVPFYIVPVLQSAMAVFAILWGVLFFHETITLYIVCGTAAFILGLIGLQLSK